MQGSTKHIKYYKRRRKCNKQRKETNYKEKELRNKGRDSLNVSHRALDQSKRELVKKSSNLSSDLSPQKSADCIPFKYTTSNTMVLNSNC